LLEFTYYVLTHANLFNDEIFLVVSRQI